MGVSWFQWNLFPVGRVLREGEGGLRYVIIFVALFSILETTEAYTSKLNFIFTPPTLFPKLGRFFLYIYFTCDSFSVLLIVILMFHLFFHLIAFLFYKGCLRMPVKTRMDLRLPLMGTLLVPARFQGYLKFNITLYHTFNFWFLISDLT